MQRLTEDSPEIIRRAIRIVAGMGDRTCVWLVDWFEITAVCREIDKLSPAAMSITERSYKYGLQWRVWKLAYGDVEFKTQIFNRMAKTSAVSYRQGSRQAGIELCEAIRRTSRCCKWPVKQPDGSWIVEKTPPRKKHR